MSFTADNMPVNVKESTFQNASSIQNQNTNAHYDHSMTNNNLTVNLTLPPKQPQTSTPPLPNSLNEPYSTTNMSVTQNPLDEGSISHPPSLPQAPVKVEPQPSALALSPGVAMQAVRGRLRARVQKVRNVHRAVERFTQKLHGEDEDIEDEGEVECGESTDAASTSGAAAVHAFPEQETEPTQTTTRPPPTSTSEPQQHVDQPPTQPPPPPTSIPTPMPMPTPLSGFPTQFPILQTLAENMGQRPIIVAPILLNTSMVGPNQAQIQASSSSSYYYGYDPSHHQSGGYPPPNLNPYPHPHSSPNPYPYSYSPYPYPYPHSYGAQQFPQPHGSVPMYHSEPGPGSPPPPPPPPPPPYSFTTNGDEFTKAYPDSLSSTSPSDSESSDSTSTSTSTSNPSSSDSLWGQQSASSWLPELKSTDNVPRSLSLLGGDNSTSMPLPSTVTSLNSSFNSKNPFFVLMQTQMGQVPVAPVPVC